MLTAVVFVMAVRAEDDRKEDSESVSASVQTLIKEYQQAQRDFSTDYRQAKTNEERQQVLKARPTPDVFAQRFLSIVEDHPSAPAAVDALAWVCANVRSGVHHDHALKQLLDQHVESEKLAAVCQRLQFSQSTHAEAFLRAVLQKNSHNEVKAQACFGLAKYLKRQAATISYLTADAANKARYEQFYGKEYVERLAARNVEELSAEIETLFERVTSVEEFASIKSYRGTLANAAERELFEIRHLAIGQVAPEIDGEDIGNVRFKLSDYRGKVVVLDFWGHW